MKKAFTLAELLMAVLVISIIMVALAPVITRRAYDNVSIEVNKKKGLEIFTNPGTYTFDVPIGINTLFLSGSGGGGGGGGATYVDKSTSFSSSTSWSIPQGVNQITFVITGSGGGGGAANGSSTGRTQCDDPTGEYLFIRGASDGSDLCWTKNNVVEQCNMENGATQIIEAVDMGTKTCTTGYCCWKHATLPAACTKKAAVTGCGAYRTNCNRYNPQGYRLPNKTEFETVGRYRQTFSDLWNTGKFNLCNGGDGDAGGAGNYRVCGWYGGCQGGSGGMCAPWRYMGSDVYMHFNGLYAWGLDTSASAISNDVPPASVRCVKPLARYNRYSGAGGASGAQLQRTINVLPSDTLTITIGAGGNGGNYNSTVNNGAGSRAGNGNRGADTQIIHKRNGSTIGTYRVKGGFGGWGATTSANGAAFGNGTASGQTTPSDTCYANANVGCTKLSYSGAAGGTSSGGSGGRVGNSGTAVNGGLYYVDTSRSPSSRSTTTEVNYAKGQNAATAGFGAGGGLTPSWAAGTSNFYGGGKGAAGKVDISYRVILPGGGAGAAGSAGLNNDRVTSELKYKVEEGKRIVFTIGQGGDGGQEGQDGIDGTNTIIDDNKIIFYGGKGGRVSTAAQKNSLLGGSGGTGSGVLYNGSTINKGANGAQGQFKISGTLASYGFDGGVGGKTFLNFDGGCGGGIITKNITTYNCTTQSSANGLEARAHDPINDRHGGSGGGGGGAITNSAALGRGGNGSSGYLRIRWDETEQE